MSWLLVDLPARVLLFPVLIWQALDVRRRALGLPEAAGPREGAAGSGRALRVLILGDSSAAGVGVTHQDQALSGQLVARLAVDHHVMWRLEARTGRTTKGMLDRLAEMEDVPFDVAVVALGVNDVTRAVPRQIWLNRQRRLIDTLQGRFGVTRICLSGLPPMGHFPLLPHPLRWILGRQADRFDRSLRDLVRDHDDTTVSPMLFELDISQMAEDGFHPGPAVYAAWAEMLVPLITGPKP